MSDDVDDDIPAQKGPVILTKFSKFAMLHVVLDRQKISKTVLDQAFSFIFWHFHVFSVFVLIKF
jgi:hypothetical protein